MSLIEEFPDWIPKAEWNAWIKLRKAKRAPLIPEAFPRQWAKLMRYFHEQELTALGIEAHTKLVLEQSIDRGYTGIFPVNDGYLQERGLATKGDHNGTYERPARTSRSERATEAHRAYAADAIRQAEAEESEHLAGAAQPSTRH